MRVGDVKSAWKEVNIGTPQGSLLGPFMFIILMNFILIKIEAGNYCRTIAYADDTTLLFRIDPAEAHHEIQEALVKVEGIVRLFARHGLAINANKTNITLFRPARRTIRVDPVAFCGIMMPWSKSVRCLGLTLNETLRWQDHLSSCMPKCYAVVATLRRLRELGVPVEGLVCLYRVLLEPLLCYGISVWGGGYNYILRKGEVVQNDALRAIVGRRRRDSVSNVLVKFDLLPLARLYSLHVALLAFKMVKGRVPSDISFPITAVVKRTDRRATDFVIPFARKESSRHALACRLPAVWGSLPREIRSLTSAKRFAGEVRKFL